MPAGLVIGPTGVLVVVPMMKEEVPTMVESAGQLVTVAAQLMIVLSTVLQTVMVAGVWSPGLPPVLAMAPVMVETISVL